MKVAVIGGGIVGATCAYYLSKEKNIDLTVFDYGVGQATKASAGIISPWFSKRRNKAWYTMAKEGAAFYEKLTEDLMKDGYSTKFYNKCGVYLLKKDETKLEELYNLAENRKQDAPMIGELKILSFEEVQKVIPKFSGVNSVLYASGGGRVEGERFVNTLLEAANVEVVQKKVSLKKENNRIIIDNEKFDKVVLATGAWLKEILEPCDYEVAVRPQKGQLRDYKTNLENSGDYPVIMPEGEIDIIPFENGVVSVGATHEDDKDFDLSVDKEQLAIFEDEAAKFLPNLRGAKIKNERVGIRAYTADYAPFYGFLPDNKNILVASGLGSSGLTTGPIIGYNLACLLLGKKGNLDEKNYPVERYIKINF